MEYALGSEIKYDTEEMWCGMPFGIQRQSFLHGEELERIYIQ